MSVMLVRHMRGADGIGALWHLVCCGADTVVHSPPYLPLSLFRHFLSKTIDSIKQPRIDNLAFAKAGKRHVTHMKHPVGTF
jgi:hypothetical protein